MQNLAISGIMATVEKELAMYDNGPVFGRNDECWCGSGKKYKKCHLAIDERLNELWERVGLRTHLHANRRLSLIHI